MMDDFQFTLKAGETRAFPLSGTVLFCDSASRPFQVAFDGKKNAKMRPGMKLTKGKGFRSVTFKEISGFDTDVTVYYGNIEAGDDIEFFADRSVKKADTYPKGYQDGNPTPIIPANDQLIFSGTDAGNKRDQMFITNKSAGVVLQVCDITGGRLFDLNPGEKVPLVTSGQVMILNDNGVDCPVLVGELFYS